MKKNQFKRGLQLLCISTLLIGTHLSLSAQEFKHEKLWSFESINKQQWKLRKGHKITTSSDHYKHGGKSLQWSWQKAGAITLLHDIGFQPFNPEGEDKSIPSFAFWMYNETPVDAPATFVFGTDDTDNCQFTFKLDFKGWRSAWVSFERDMEGTPVTGMNRLRIESPKSVNKGQLFIDHMMLCHNIDSRHHTPDNQVPFVNKGTTSHWLIQQEASLAQPDIPAPAKVSKEDIQYMENIENRFQQDILKKQSVNEKTVEELRTQFSTYEIARKGDQITGLPIWFGRNAELYIPLISHKEAKNFYNKTGQNAKVYFDFMLKVATAHVNSSSETLKKELASMYLDLYDHMVDQGFAAGSGLGTIHHYGYNWRSYYRALFLMRDVLEANNHLQEAVAGMQWFASVGETFHAPETYGMDMDAFNTQVMGRLASILIMADSPEKVQYLNCFSRWINNGLMPAPGLNDAFKIDGSAYHHANHYPAYATGGMNGAVRMVYFLSDSPFAVSQTAHETLKKALLTMRFYCNFLHWPTSMSGRHPEGKGKLDRSHFAILAKAGSPDGTQKIDGELASAYLRLMTKKKDRFAKEFTLQGQRAEATPSGHITMPYACSSIHRRNEWAVSVRGHSRYLWASEHYLGANLYGRYLAHGQLQIMGAGDPVTPKSSGFVQQGWDWNRFPGTTVINLPVEELRADIRNVDQFSGYEEMLFSDEAFAGGVHANNQNGVYAFILHEHDKYQGTLRARKSWFFFDDKIVCLGSGIENKNAERPTETTLFQNHLGKKDQAVIVNATELKSAELEKRYEANHMWMMDNKGNGYLITAGSVYFRQGLQHSRDESSEKPTKGEFATAVIEHGKAPEDATYHYCVIPATTQAKVKKLAQDSEYEVLAQSKQKHIVHNEASNETGYVFFEAAQDNKQGIIRHTNLPCIALSKMNSQALELNVVNPDLALYEGPADEIYKDGKRVERSIYGRPWRPAESRTTTLEIEIEGKWRATKETTVLNYTEAGNTIVSVQCKDGLTQQVLLEQIN
ncbi:MAG: hypothetical protein JEZ14_16690 [Marinilabiliaceae bacterium]|nr:hypothetical protein [Marinilabiliaceae bacterium]